jgi:hypothetical protein
MHPKRKEDEFYTGHLFPAEKLWAIQKENRKQKCTCERENARESFSRVFLL